MVTDIHEPNPAWGCRGCGKDWPCEEARDALLDEHKDDPGRLAIKMCKMLEYAAPVLVRAGLHPDEMFQRFIAWTRRAPLDVAVPSPDAGVPGARP